MSGVNYFLKLDGIDGESKDVKHKNELQIESWSFGTLHYRDPLGGRSKTSLSEINFTMRLDKASTKLMLACGSGQKIATAILTCHKAGGDNAGEEYLTVTLTEVFIASVSISSAKGGGDPTPFVSFSLVSKTIKVEYKTQTQKGSLSGSVGYQHTVGTGT